MAYFEDDITPADVDYIFNEKPYQKPVDVREQFYADIAARQPGVYQQMQNEAAIGITTTQERVSQDVLNQRRQDLGKTFHQELIAAPVEDAQTVVDKYREQADKPLTMREVFYEQQNIPLKDDLELARNLLSGTSAAIPTDLFSTARGEARMLAIQSDPSIALLPQTEQEMLGFNMLDKAGQDRFLQEDKDVGKARAGFLRSIPAFTMAWMSQAAKDVTGDQNFLYGNAVEALAKHIYYSYDKQKAAEDVITSVRKHSGILGENDFDVASTLDLINDYIGKIDQGTEEDFTSKMQGLLLNGFGLLDMVPDFIPNFNKAVKATKANGAVEPLAKDVGTVLGDVAAHDKQAGDTLAAIALQEPSGKGAEVLGTSKEKLATNSVPGFEYDGLRVAGSDATKQLQENISVAIKTAEDITPASLYQFVDATKQQQELKGVLTQLPDNGHLPPYQSDLSLSVFQKSDDGFLRYGSVYGKSDGSSFTSIEEASAASDAIRAQFGAGPFETTGITLLQRVGNTNTWEKAVAGSGSTEFKVQLDVKQKMRWETDHVIPEKAVTPALFATRYFQNIHATLSEDYVAALTVANERASKLYSDIMRINEPMARLNEFKKQPVLKAIVDGGEQEKVFTDAELVNLYKLDGDQIHAYHSERAMWDTIHYIKNREEYTTKLSEGYVRIKADLPDGTQSVDAMGKAVDLNNFTGVEKVVAVVDGNVQVINKTDTDQFLREGYQAYALADTYTLPGDARYKFMLAKPSEHIQPLPERILPYRTGYYYKINKGKYFVEKEFTGELNGVKHSFKRAVAIADSPGAAQKAVDAGVGDSFKVDENIVNNHDFANWIEVNTPTTGYWYTKRQPQMPTYSIDLQGNLQRVTSKSEDPIAAAEAAAAKVSNFVAWRDTIQTYEQLHKNTYPELWTSDGARSLYLGTQAADNTPRVRAANAMFDHITSLTSYASRVDSTWNNWMVSADRLFSNHRLGEHTSKLFLDAGVKANPSRLLTSGVYYTQVVSAPFRQFLLNIMTPTLYAGIAPKTWARSIKDAYLVYAKLTGGHLPLRSVQISNSLRMAGKGADDIEDLAKHFVSTGKVETVDSHIQAHNEMLKMFKGGSGSKTEALFRESTKPLKKVINTIREQGVVKGELFNRVFSFVFAKNMLEAERGALRGHWSEKVNLEKISNKANQLGLDMTKVGAYEYQTGLVRPLTQFLGVMQQALAVLVPRIPGIVRGNRAYDGKRAAVLLGLLSLWGAQGLPFSPDELIDGYLKQQLQDKGIDLSVLDSGALYALHEILLRGALGAAMAEGVRLAVGQEETVTSEISNTISPVAAGANPFIERLINSEGSLLELLAGPSLNLVNNVSIAAKSTRLLLHGYKTEELSLEKLKDIAVTWAAILPSMSNFMQATASIKYEKEIGAYFDFNKKDARLTSNLGEQLVKAFTSIKPHTEQTYYDILKTNKGMEDSAKQDKDVIKRLWLNIATDEALTFDQKVDKIATISTGLSSNQIYNNYILDSLRIDLVNDPTLNPIINTFIKDKLIKSAPEAVESTKKELQRFFAGNPLLPKEEQLKLYNLVETYAEDANKAIEIYNATTD